MCVQKIFISVNLDGFPLLEKNCFYRLTVMFSMRLQSYLILEGRIWALIVPVPGNCLSLTFQLVQSKPKS